MQEKSIIAACFKDRSTVGLIDLDVQFSQIGQGIFDLVYEFYALDKTAKECKPEWLMDRVSSKFQDSAQINAAWDYLNSLPIASVSLPNVAKDIQEYNKNLAHKQLERALAVGTQEEIDLALDLYTQVRGGLSKADNEEMVYENISVASLIKTSFSEEGTIKLWPKQLNNLCDGGARRGHHILVFARPEIGKTLFAQNMVAGFLKQGLKVLYVGNEDPASDILLRQIVRLSKLPKESVKADPDKAEEKARENGYGNLVVAALAPGNFRQIRALVEKKDPAVVVLDQLRNLDVGDASFVQALEKAATEARNLGKRYNVLVVSITQAGDSASGKAILGREDVDSSKTGIPAQVDLMVGIGADAIMEKTGFRTVSTPKNKLGGKHESFTVSIDPRIGTILNS